MMFRSPAGGCSPPGRSPGRFAHARGHGFAWHYFVTGSGELFTGHGLHLYATDAELQSGPLSFVAVAPLTKLLPGRSPKPPPSRS